MNKVALGRRNGTATLSTYVDGNDGMMTLYPQETMSIKSNQAVRIQTLDDYYKVNAIKMNEKITLIKIDVEGSELETIEGAKEFISINRPTVVMEINSLLLSSSGTTSTAVLDLMKSLGYAAFWIDERGKIEVCRDHSYPPHESVLGNSAGANYLFLHKDEMKKPLLNELVRQYQL
jgi:hypothetical protein